MKIFHTADVHVGLTFKSQSRAYDDELRDMLVAERIEVIERMVEMANDQSCNLFVVAGDLFDRQTVPKGQVQKTAKALNEFAGPVVVLPGNHDYYQEEGDNLWSVFIGELNSGSVLTSNSPVELHDFGVEAVIYPGVCHSRHSKENAIGWISQEELGDTSDVRIGVAHGNLVGHSYDENGEYYSMTEQELNSLGMDVWLLGHIHVRLPKEQSGSRERIFYPAIPEPASFRCDHEGFAWIIEIDDEKNISYTSHQTGRFRFHAPSHFTVNNETDFDKIRAYMRDKDPGKDLVRFSLEGRLTGELYEELPAFQKELAERARYLQMKFDDVRREIGQKEIDEHFIEDSFPHKLLSRLSADDETALALQLAYEKARSLKENG